MKTRVIFKLFARALLVVGMTSTPLLAQTERVKFTLKGSWPGYPRGTPFDVAVVGNRAYAAIGAAGLAVFDLSDPRNPVRLGSSATSRPAEAIRVSGNYAYVLETDSGAAGQHGLFEIFDVSQPANPRSLSSYAGASTFFDLQVSGRHVFLGASRLISQDGGLEVVDISNPVSPRRVGTYGPAEVVGIDVVGDYLYASVLQGGLHVLDVSVPSQPVLVGQTPLEGSTLSAHVAGDYAYMSVRPWGGGGKLQIIDVRNPFQPSLVGSYDTADAPRDVHIGDGFACVISARWTGVRSVGEFETIDVHDPAQPVGLNRMQVEGYTGNGWNHGLELVGTHAYLMAGGLQVLDLTDPLSPVSIGRADTSGFARAVRVSGAHAYLAEDRLHVIDVSEPEHPVRVGGEDQSGFPQALAVAGTNIYVADLFSGLRVLDVSNPTRPVQVGTLDTGGCEESPNVLQLLDQRAYLTGGQPAFQVLDVSAPTKPTRMGGYPIAGAVKGVHVSGHRAYVVGDRDDGEDYVGFLQILDVSQPANPLPMGQTDTATQGYGVALAGDHAYVVGETTALTVVNVSNATRPIPVGRYEANGWAEAVQVVGDEVFIAGEFIGCAALDASNPTNPVRIGSYPLGTGEDEGWDLQVVGNHAYLARGYSGLLVFEITEVPFFKSVSRAGDKLVLTWKGTAGLKVQRTTSLTDATWSDVQGSAGQSTMELPLSSGSEFFRLVKE